MSEAERIRRIEELERTVRLLTEEKELLMEKAEDIYLLGILAEKFSLEKRSDPMVRMTLEAAVSLKEIAYAAQFSIQGENLVVLDDQGLDIRYSQKGKRIPLAPPMEDTFFLRKKFSEILPGDPLPDFFPEWTAPTFPNAYYLMPVQVRNSPHSVFLFVNSIDDSSYLKEMLPLLCRIGDLLSARLESLSLLSEIAELNRTLEEKVQARTGELMQTNVRLKAEVAERRQTEEELKRFRTLINQSNDAIFVIEPATGRFLDINEKACTSLGYTRDELLSMRVSDIELLIPNHPAWKEEVQRIQGEEGSASMIQGKHLRKDGSSFPVEVNANLISQGKTAYLIAVARDVSDRRELEAQLLQSQKMEALGRFAGGIAHDFNNILTAIIGHAELLMMEHDSKSPDYEGLKAIRDVSERAARLTRQILAFSKRQVMEPVVLNPNETIGGMSGMFTRLLGEDVEYRFLPGRGLRMIEADRTKLEQVILNLVVNARDAMPDGGCLTIQTENIHLTGRDRTSCHDLPPGDFVLLSVSDTGSGMSEEVKTHIFEPFFTTKKEGTGLGLSTVYGIVKQIGGYLDVSSHPGEGTLFHVYLPAFSEETRGGEKAAKAKKLPKGKEVILVVEDEPGILKLAAQILEFLGYTVLTSNNGEEALALFKSRPGRIDLLLTDIVLPDIKGTEIAQRMRTIDPSIHILFMSGYPEGPSSKTGHFESGDLFLPKPFTPSMLAMKVREVLNR